MHCGYKKLVYVKSVNARVHVKLSSVKKKRKPERERERERENEHLRAYTLEGAQKK